MDGAFGLFDHQLVGAADHDAHSLPGAGAAGDLQRAAAKAHWKHKLRLSNLCEAFQDLRVKSDAYLDQFARAVEADLLRQLRRAQHLWSEVVDVGDGFGANCLERSKERFNMLSNMCMRDCMCVLLL